MFSSEDQLREENEQRMREEEWLTRRDIPNEQDGEDLGAIKEDPPKGGANFIPGVDDDDDDDGSSDDESQKNKGVSYLIEIENPNRREEKQSIKVEEIGEVKMTRKQREQAQYEKDRARQLRQMQEGTSAQAKRDIARLEQIKKEREEASKRREMERKAKEERDQQRLASLK